ncbi:MAG: hypothetical protein KGH61_01205 [Candidatus Micrarchaeota archaeon]|nr:hypothetical protein [Candidatus Micrarchaeota archaeon]MDE1847549.1 hypothetical protein [Candidatus Micrarchaeota archaeon]MDE1864266.1 hypothetical protein [Candidatus Micrarchaeota archaeon]
MDGTKTFAHERMAKKLEDAIGSILREPRNAEKASKILISKNSDYNIGKFMLKKIRRKIEKDLSNDLNREKDRKSELATERGYQIARYATLPSIAAVGIGLLVMGITDRFGDYSAIIAAVPGLIGPLGSLIVFSEIIKGDEFYFDKIRKGISEAGREIDEIRKKIAFIKYSFHTDLDLQAIYKRVKKQDGEMRDAVVRMTKSEFDKVAKGSR